MDIVDTQQMGQKRAKYGSKVIKILSEKLQEEFGKGFSEDTLKNARKFYLTYKERKSETVFSLFEKNSIHCFLIALFAVNAYRK